MEPARRECFVEVVDDDAGVREATESLLRSAAFATQRFGSAEEFLESHHNDYARCLILDVGLPGMNGIELQAHLSRSVDIVFVSGITDNNGLMKAQALCAGAVAFCASRLATTSFREPSDHVLTRDFGTRAVDID